MKSVQETDIDLNYVRDGQSVSDGDFAKYWGGGADITTVVAKEDGL